MSTCNYTVGVGHSVSQGRGNCSQIAPKVIKSTVFDKMGRSSKEEASLTLVS